MWPTACFFAVHCKNSFLQLFKKKIKQNKEYATETICVPQSLKIFTLSLYKMFADPYFIKNCFLLVAIQSFHQDLLTEKQTLSCLHF